MARQRRWLVGILVVAVLIAWGWWASRPQPVAVTLAEAQTGDVEKTVANTRAGTVTACRRAQLSPSLGGQMSHLPVKEGDEVEAGDLLLELWNQDIVAELALAEKEAEASRSTAHAACIKADEARRDADRQEKLRDRGLVSEETVDSAVTQARALRADCAAARSTTAVRDARVDVVRANLRKTRLYAPFDGIVAEVNGELNEYVTPSPPGIPTLPAVDLIDNNCFYVAAPIDEVDVAEVKVGQPARVTLDAFSEQDFEGRVRRISAYVRDYEKQARTVDVEVSFSNEEDIRRLLAGYSADVEIILEVRKNTLRIPTEAVMEDDQVYVYLPDGLLEKRRIETGTANWDHTEVLKGLQAGDRVVTSVDREGVEDGAQATIDTAE